MKRDPYSSQAFIDGGWHAIRGVSDGTVVSGGSNGRPGHLKRGPTSLRNSIPFRHTWALTMAPVNGLEVTDRDSLAP